ncbi:Uncharacterised protein [Legionella beliardensis]|uniref:Secreted protein n=1 Tax=Legionella beliardensis TaxID=91822 RepID=A0A378I2A6_9GAMM|nr:hypothetical protein [Legionella beliardensis]STX28831.1 Uncharacterised protein [Legionella beliardensis]
MKGLIFLLLLLSGSLAFAAQKAVVCHMQGLTGTLSFPLPNKMGGLPTIDFDYPVTATRFSMRDGNLLLIAMDKDEMTRPRIFISAQLNKQGNAYLGQFMIDSGGNQLQLDNGPVSCLVK